MDDTWSTRARRRLSFLVLFNIILNAERYHPENNNSSERQ